MHIHCTCHVRITRLDPAGHPAHRLKLSFVNGLLWILKGSGVLDNGGGRTGYRASSNALWVLLDKGTCSSLSPQPFRKPYHYSTVFKQILPPTMPDAQSTTASKAQSTTKLTQTPTEVPATTIATSKGKTTTPSSDGTHLQFGKGGEAFDRARKLLSNGFMLRPWEERAEVSKADKESSL